MIDRGTITQEEFSEFRILSPFINVFPWTTPNFTINMLPAACARLEAYLKRKLTVAPSPLRTILDQLPDGWMTAYAVLKTVADRERGPDSEEAKILGAWEELQAVHGPDATPEMVAESVGISESHLLGLIVEDAHSLGVVTANLVKAVNLGEIMNRAIKEAKKPSGFKDRERILQSSGLYPSPAGATFNLTANAQAGAKSGVVQRGIEASDEMDEFERDTVESTSFLRTIDVTAEPAKLISPANFVDETIVTKPITAIVEPPPQSAFDEQLVESQE